MKGFQICLSLLAIALMAGSASAAMTASIDFENYTAGSSPSATNSAWSVSGGPAPVVSTTSPISGTKSLELGKGTTVLYLGGIYPGYDLDMPTSGYTNLTLSMKILAIPDASIAIVEPAGWYSAYLYFDPWFPGIEYNDGGTTQYLNGGYDTADYVKTHPHSLTITVNYATRKWGFTMTDLATNTAVANLSNLDFASPGHSTTNNAQQIIWGTTAGVQSGDPYAKIDDIFIAVPEPATLALLGIGSLLCVRRK